MEVRRLELLFCISYVASFVTLTNSFASLNSRFFINGKGFSTVP